MTLFYTKTYNYWDTSVPQTFSLRLIMHKLKVCATTSIVRYVSQQVYQSVPIISKFTTQCRLYLILSLYANYNFSNSCLSFRELSESRIGADYTDYRDFWVPV